MGQTSQRKIRDQHALIFDALHSSGFAVVTLAASTSNTVVAQRLLAPAPVKIYRVMASVDGTVAGTCAINIVAGVAPENGTGQTDTFDNGANAYPRPIAPAGTQLFANDVVLTMTPDVPQQIDVPAPFFDVIWKGLLTLRVTTGAGTTGNLRVSIISKITDTSQPLSPYGYPATPSLAGPTYPARGAFLPANDIP